MPDNKKTCLEMISKRVKAPHPSNDELTIVGVVVAYDNRPFQRRPGHYVVIKPDRADGEVCHPAWVTVIFETVTML